MRHSQRRHVVRLAIVWIVMSATLIGCSLSFNTGSDSPSNPDTNANANGGGGDTGIAPVARITDPASGTVIAANQRLDIIVQTDTTATRFQLNVSGQVASTKALPDDQSGPTSAILSWTPQYQGTYTLEIIAYNGMVPGPPATADIVVSGTASGGQASTVSGCTGRALVSQLNFRGGPGTGNTMLGQFETGETFTVIGRNNDNSWLKVQRINAQQVWVINNAQWVQTEGQCGGLPEVN